MVNEDGPSKLKKKKLKKNQRTESPEMRIRETVINYDV